MIYFIKCGDFVKIGYSKSVEKRLKSLQTANPNQLEIISSFDGNRKEEEHIHYRFRKFKVSGDWFILTDEIKEYAIKRKGKKPKQLFEDNLNKGDIVRIVLGKYKGRLAEVMTKPSESGDVMIGFGKSNNYHTFIIDGYDLSLEEKRS